MARVLAEAGRVCSGYFWEWSLFMAGGCGGIPKIARTQIMPPLNNRELCFFPLRTCALKYCSPPRNHPYLCVLRHRTLYQTEKKVEPKRLHPQTCFMVRNSAPPVALFS